MSQSRIPLYPSDDTYANYGEENAYSDFSYFNLPPGIIHSDTVYGKTDSTDNKDEDFAVPTLSAAEMQDLPHAYENKENTDQTGQLIPDNLEMESDSESSESESDNESPYNDQHDYRMRQMQSTFVLVDENALRDVCSANHGLKDELGKAQHELRRIEDELTDKISNNQELNVQLQRMTNENFALNQGNLVLQNKVAELEETVASYQRVLADLQRKPEFHQRAVPTNTSRLPSLTSEIPTNTSNSRLPSLTSQFPFYNRGSYGQEFFPRSRDQQNTVNPSAAGLSPIRRYNQNQQDANGAANRGMDLYFKRK